MVGSSIGMPSGALGKPTFVSPVRMGAWPMTVLASMRVGLPFLLAVPVGEDGLFFSDSINVRFVLSVRSLKSDCQASD